jgi:RHS repeat-associated protein
VEWIKYTPYGEPISIPAGDTDSNFAWDDDDADRIAWYIESGGTYDVRLNPTLTGSVSYADITYASSITGGYQTLGRGVLSSQGVQNRFGHAGYRYDHHLAGADRHLYHVRHRVYQAHIGRWATRDFLGYLQGMSLYQYVLSQPILRTDPSGLLSLPLRGATSHGCGVGCNDGRGSAGLAMVGLNFLVFGQPIPVNPRACPGFEIEPDPDSADPCDLEKALVALALINLARAEYHLAKAIAACIASGGTACPWVIFATVDVTAALVALALALDQLEQCLNGNRGWYLSRAPRCFQQTCTLKRAVPSVTIDPYAPKTTISCEYDCGFGITVTEPGPTLPKAPPYREDFKKHCPSRVNRPMNHDPLTKRTTLGWPRECVKLVSD